MASRIRIRVQMCAGCVVALVLGNASGAAQSIPQAAPANALSALAIAPDSEDALHTMARIADVIFAGQVIAIRRHEAAYGATGLVEISFSVSDAIRGVSVGTYTVREWGGLWASGYEPFHVGERYLMLLHAPGAAGLSSPVGGSDGAIPIRGEGGLRVAGASPLTADAMVDLRWVATRTAHSLSYRAEQAGRPTSRAEQAGRPTSLSSAIRADTADGEAAQVDLAASTQSEGPAAGGAAYATVLGKFRSWEKSDHAAR